jgi:2-polyprenyl-3-methyl-5-hydroxy-6-metoxy-1,4-benzoquinol methylase
MFMEIHNFTNTFLDCIKPGNKVLDIGAGDGKFAQMFLDRGAIVTAADTKPPTFQDPALIVKKMKIEDFCANEDGEQYDLVFARNVIQFLDKSWVCETLFPWLDKHLAKDGIVAIETFYQDPEPAFTRRMPSLWTLAELTSFLMTETGLYAKEIYAKQFDHIGFDMNGLMRKFFVTSLITQKMN